MTFGYAQSDPFDRNSGTNVLAFAIRQMLAQISTMKLVRIEAVHAGAGGAAGTVDVLPLVNQVDGMGNAIEHGTVYGIPWFRLQGGTGAVVCDPVVGDIGFVVCADRDISAVKAARERGNPGSFRTFDIADGVYVGGILNEAPDTRVEFKADGGLKVVDAHGNVLETTASGFAVTTAPGGSFTVNGISVTTHVHSGVTTGAGTSGPPVP